MQQTRMLGAVCWHGLGCVAEALRCVPDLALYSWFGAHLVSSTCPPQGLGARPSHLAVTCSHALCPSVVSLWRAG